MKRVLVIGSGGAGKSTLAQRLGQLLDIEVKHLDRFYWRAGWTEPAKEDWLKTVAELTSGDSWIMDGNFGGTLEFRLERCDTVIFLDMSRLLCIWRIAKRRLLYRSRSRPDMAEGCHEKLDREFIQWVWNYSRRTRPKVVKLLEEHSRSKRIVWLRSNAEVEKFLEGLSPRTRMDDQTYALADKIWDYHLMKHQVAKADAILVLCSHDERVAERGAQLFLEGWAPLIIFSGGRGAITKALWDEPEAERFARIAMRLNVPRESILIEAHSTNTGENVEFTKRLLAERGLDLHKFIVVQKPYMERRAFATFRKLWPEKEVVVTSPQVSFRNYLAEYANPSLSAGDVVSIMVGDLQRIKLYPARGYQIAQEIPDDVWDAFERLVRAGYDKYLICS